MVHFDKILNNLDYKIVKINLKNIVYKIFYVKNTDLGYSLHQRKPIYGVLGGEGAEGVEFTLWYHSQTQQPHGYGDYHG